MYVDENNKESGIEDSLLNQGRMTQIDIPPESETTAPKVEGPPVFKIKKVDKDARKENFKKIRSIAMSGLSLAVLAYAMHKGLNLDAMVDLRGIGDSVAGALGRNIPVWQQIVNTSTDLTIGTVQKIGFNNFYLGMNGLKLGVKILDAMGVGEKIKQHLKIKKVEKGPQQISREEKE